MSENSNNYHEGRERRNHEIFHHKEHKVHKDFYKEINPLYSLCSLWFCSLWFFVVSKFRAFVIKKVVFVQSHR